MDAGALDEHPEELIKAAMLSSRFGRPERAEAVFRRVLEVNPTGMAHLSFAFVLEQQGNLAEAVVQLETALERFGQELTPQQAQMARMALEQWRARQ